MKKTLAAGLLASVVAGPALAADCSDVVWHQDVLAQYPSVANACQEVIEKDGKQFVKLKAEFVRYREPHKAMLDVYETDGSKQRQTVSLKPNATVNAGGNMIGWDALPRGYELEFYVPSDRFEVDEVTMVTPVAPVEPETQPAALPKTASWVPALGAAGMLLLGLGQLFGRRRRGQ